MNEIFGYLIVIFISANPVWEVRLGIPLGVFLFDQPLWAAGIAGLFGNLLVIPIARRAFVGLDKLAKKVGFLAVGLNWLYARTQKKLGGKVERAKEVAVFGLIAIPVPGTGAWSGVLAEHIFGLEPRRSLPYLLAGITSSVFITTWFVAAGKLVFSP